MTVRVIDGMPTISKFYGIVIRMMRLREFGARFHAIYENSELVVNLWPLRIVAGIVSRFRTLNAVQRR